MYIYYSIGNNLRPRTLVCIVEVSVIGEVCFRRFHCNHILPTGLETKCARPLMYFWIQIPDKLLFHKSSQRIAPSTVQQSVWIR